MSDLTPTPETLTTDAVVTTDETTSAAPLAVSTDPTTIAADMVRLPTTRGPVTVTVSAGPLLTFTDGDEVILQLDHDLANRVASNLTLDLGLTVSFGDELALVNSADGLTIRRQDTTLFGIDSSDVPTFVDLIVAFGYTGEISAGAIAAATNRRLAAGAAPKAEAAVTEAIAPQPAPFELHLNPSVLSAAILTPLEDADGYLAQIYLPGWAQSYRIARSVADTFLRRASHKMSIVHTDDGASYLFKPDAVICAIDVTPLGGQGLEVTFYNQIRATQPGEATPAPVVSFQLALSDPKQRAQVNLLTGGRPAELGVRTRR